MFGMVRCSCAVAGFGLAGVLLASCSHLPPLSTAPADVSGIEAPYPGFVRGVVVARIAEVGRRGGLFCGFVLQSAHYASDGVPGTCDGIFVGTYTNRAVATRDGWIDPQVGDELILRGKPTFFNGRPALSNPFVIRVVRHHEDLDESVPTFDADPPADAVAATNYWAARHAMRCRIAAGATVQGAHFGDPDVPNASITLLRPDHPIAARPASYARRVFRDAHPLDDIPERRFDNGNGFRIGLADGGVKAIADDPQATFPPVRTFDRLQEDLVGVVLWTGDGYSVHPTTVPVFVPGPPPDKNGPPPVHHTRAQLRLASVNLEALFDFRDDPFDAKDFHRPTAGGIPDGTGRLKNYAPASDAAYRRRLQGLAAQIVHDLESPDVLMVQEAEDQDIGYMHNGALRVDPVNNRDGRLDVLQELAAEIVRAGGHLYLSAADRAGADERGIICAFLYRQDRLRLTDIPEGHPVLSGAIKTPFATETLAYGFAPSNPRALNGVSALGGGMVMARAVQVACFERVVGTDLAFPVGQKLYLLANHFKSVPNAHVANRIEQAHLTAAIASAVMQTEPGAWVVAGGDLNTFPRPDEPIPDQPGDQLGALYTAGLANLYDTELARHPESAYSYVYQGQAQTLDQLFVSTNLLVHLKDVRSLHINSDYSPDPRTPNRRASDHDPRVAVFLGE